MGACPCRTRREFRCLAALHSGGHPEGCLEAFANIYRLAFDDITRAAQREPLCGGYPSVHDGLRGMRFVSGALESSRQEGRWVKL